MSAYDYLAVAYEQLMEVNYDSWYSYLTELIACCDVKGRRLLDCACGTGQFSARFGRDGWQVVGIDVSPAMLNEAWKKKAAGFKMEFAVQDVRTLELGKTFDVVICACDGFNYLLDENDLQKALNSIKSHLSPGGSLLFDISSKYKLKNILGDNVYAEAYADYPYIWENSWDEDTSTVNMGVTLFLPEEGTGLYRRCYEEHVQRAWEVGQISDALASAGFTDIFAYEAFTTEPPRSDSERIQFVARI